MHLKKHPNQLWLRAGYGYSHWTSKLGDFEGWRESVALQFVPALIFIIGLPFLPETWVWFQLPFIWWQADFLRPRWLLEKGHTDAAHKSLVFLRAAENNPEVIEEEFTEIRESIEMNKSVKEAAWHELFTDRFLFSRLWKGALLQFMAQMCGATAIKYYLPTVFLALGLSKDMSLMASGIESTLKIGLTIMEMFIIDKIGRRNSLLIGAVVMSVAMVVRYVLKKIGSEANCGTGQWSITFGVPEQQEPRFGLCLHRVHIPLLLRIFSWLWSQCVGVRNRSIIWHSFHLETKTDNYRSSPHKSVPRESVFVLAPVPSDLLSLGNSSPSLFKILVQKPTLFSLLLTCRVWWYVHIYS